MSDLCANTELPSFDDRCREAERAECRRKLAAARIAQADAYTLGDPLAETIADAHFRHAVAEVQLSDACAAPDGNEELAPRLTVRGASGFVVTPVDIAIASYNVARFEWRSLLRHTDAWEMPTYERAYLKAVQGAPLL